jgi:hypothetical protein
MAFKFSLHNLYYACACFKSAINRTLMIRKLRYFLLESICGAVLFVDRVGLDGSGPALPAARCERAPAFHDPPRCATEDFQVFASAASDITALYGTLAQENTAGRGSYGKSTWGLSSPVAAPVLLTF